MESLNDCAPFVTKIVRRPPAPWMTDDIKQVIEVRNSLQNHLKNDRHNTTLMTEYKNVKKKVLYLINTAKTMYYNNEISKCKNDRVETFTRNCSN